MSTFSWVVAILGSLFVAAFVSAFVGSGFGAFGGAPTAAPAPLIGMMSVPVLGAAAAALALVHYFRHKD